MKGLFLTMKSKFSAEIWYWRGPAPFYFVSLPQPDCVQLRELAQDVSYGWGMIPVRARIGRTTWDTSLFPKNGGYAVPLKSAVRDAEGLDDGDTAQVEISVEVRSGRWV